MKQENSTKPLQAGFLIGNHHLKWWRMSFENIDISNKKFSVLVHYVMNQLSHIALVSCSNEDTTEAERHQEDIEWLNELLGEPSKRDDFGIVYEYESLKVSADKYTKDNYEIVGACIQITYLRKE